MIQTATTPEKPAKLQNNKEWLKRYHEDLKRMKKEEQPLSDGRRRWFNQELEKVKQKIEVLD